MTFLKYTQADKAIFGSPGGAPRNRASINSIIIHNTGVVGGDLVSALATAASSSPSGLGTYPDVDREYATLRQSSSGARSHFLIGWSGLITQYYDAGDETAPHIDSFPNQSLYSQMPDWDVYWTSNRLHPLWKNRWEFVFRPGPHSVGEHDTPNDMPIWQSGSGLDVASISIEFQSVEASAALRSSYSIPTEFTPQQYAAARRLIVDLCSDFGIPDKRVNILGGSDVDPAGTRAMSDPARDFKWELVAGDATARYGRPSVAGPGPAHATWAGGTTGGSGRRGVPAAGSAAEQYIGGYTGTGSGTIPFNEFDYITPEERRKGIIARFFYLTDWYLNVLVDDPNSEIEDKSSSSVTYTGARTSKLSSSFKEKGGTPSLRGDIDDDPRRRYCAALVESEFYRQRLSVRQIPAITGPFNPYPVPGFPGLILMPDRPVIGMVTSVMHRIDVSSATAQTSVSLSSPRYWDEGEVWYWYGGNENSSTADAAPYAKEEQRLFKKAPLWINRYILATNNFRGGNRTVSNLDRFYLYHLGCASIEYLSNHAHLNITQQNITDFITKREPWRWNLNPDTLAIAESNLAIAGTNGSGEFLRGTLARRFLGINKPTSDNQDLNTNYKEAVKYTERYGVGEYDLLKNFLENDYYRISGGGPDRLVLAGKTWQNEESATHLVLSPVQNMIIDYMDDIEKRKIGTNLL